MLNFKKIETLNDAVSTGLPVNHELFQIYRLEQVGQGYAFDMPMHRRDFFGVVLIENQSDKGEIIINAQTHKFKKDCHLFFTSPGEMVKWSSSKDKDWTGFVIYFKREFLVLPTTHNFNYEFPFFRFDANIFMLLGTEQRFLMLELFEKMTFEYERLTDQGMAIIHSYLHIVLHQSARIYATNISQNPERITVQSRAGEITKDFMVLVHQHILQNKSVSEYADMMAMTPKHLSDYVKKASGKTASEILNAELLLRAKSFLIQSDATISEIAYQLAYKETSHFSRFFKKETGMSPITYRATNKR
ncbi:AraC family transcriptional regulator [Maribacter sp. 2307ULW6-5]|uniref:AraC family transcriptional regulator n=1 Tax=Maribacter sp. 2307ULW6-5 TaxID=3386275 RepID=UPI0039BD5EB1